MSSHVAKAILLSIAIALTACSGGNSTPGTADEAPGTGHDGVLGFEAETASVSGAFDRVADADASGGETLVPVDGVAEASTSDEDARIPFDLEEEGEYSLWVRWYAPASDRDAVHLGFNGTTERSYPSVLGTYVWSEITRESLAAGSNRISIRRAELGVRIDMFAVVADSGVTAGELEATLVDAPDAATDLPADAPGTPRTPDLRGDPAFDRSELASAQRVWHSRLWAAIENSQSDVDAKASSGDLYTYAREMNLHLNQLLMALRATGDLKLLDEIDRVTRLMEAELADPWADGTTDGYRNWQWLKSTIGAYYGKDVHEMDEGLTHSAVAAIMYAFHVNRDLPSPSGVDYAARADVWYDYLSRDFEAKWRERNDVADSFPFLTPNWLAHPVSHWIRYHYYMGEVSGNDRYFDEMRNLATVIDRNFIRTDTPQGTAFIWCHSTSDSCLGAQPTVYAKLTMNAIADLVWEEVAPFTVREHLEPLATTTSYFLVDNGTRDLAQDVAGGETWMGFEPSAGSSRHHIHNLLPISFMSKYDPSGELDEVVLQLYEDRESQPESPKELEVPAGMLVRHAAW